MKTVRLMQFNLQNGGSKNLMMQSYHQKQALSEDAKVIIANNINNIIDLIVKLKPDILVLNEFQYAYADKLFAMFETIGLKYYVYDQQLVKYPLRNGVLIATKNPFKVNVNLKLDHYQKRNFIHVTINNEIDVVGVHIPPVGKNKRNIFSKKTMLDCLLTYFTSFADSPKPAIITGDFNLAKYNTVYSEMLQYFEAKLFNYGKQTPTWRDKKLDYIFVNQQFKNKADINITFKTNYSDHAYLLADLKYPL